MANVSKLAFFRVGLAALLLILSVLASVASAAREIPFAPVPVYAIYPPLKPQGTADDALLTGHVVNDTFRPTRPASKRWQIAYLFPHLKDPYWIGCAYGVISEAKRLGGGVDILAAQGYDDLIGQLRLMDDAIAARYDAIVISPLSLTANNASIAKARALGIPVFQLANDSTSDDLTIKITSSLKDMGSKAMQWVIGDARKRGLQSINVALLPGPADAGWVKGEVEGTLEAVHTSPVKVSILDIEYGDSDRVGQTQLVAQIIHRHADQLDYILGCTGCAPAAILPIRQAGLSEKIRVVAYDLTREIANLIRKGEIAAAADTRGVSQARVSINAVVNVLEGRGRQAPHTLLVKLGVVDQGNIASYPLDMSIAPEGYQPVVSYDPQGNRANPPMP